MTLPKIPNYELEILDYRPNMALSRETVAFTARLRINRFLYTVRNDGSGGANAYYPVAVSTAREARREQESADETAMKMAPVEVEMDGEKFTLPPDLDMLVSMYGEAWLEDNKSAKKAAKQAVARN